MTLETYGTIGSYKGLGANLLVAHFTHSTISTVRVLAPAPPANVHLGPVGRLDAWTQRCRLVAPSGVIEQGLLQCTGVVVVMVSIASGQRVPAEMLRQGSYWPSNLVRLVEIRPHGALREPIKEILQAQIDVAAGPVRGGHPPPLSGSSLVL